VLLDPTSLDRSFAPGRNFVTKLWNIGRFLLTNIEALPGDDGPPGLAGLVGLTRADEWILAHLDSAIARCDAAFGPPRPGPDGTWSESERDSGMRLSEYVESARAFVWNDLADWYVEHCKARLAADWDAADRQVARAVLLHVFDSALRLHHPVVPFVTEALWQRLPGRAPGAVLARAAWPAPRDATREPAAAVGEYDLVREAVSSVRQIRADYSIAPGVVVEAIVEPAAASHVLFSEEVTAIGRLTRSRARVAASGATDHGPAATGVLSDGSIVVVPLAGVIDLAQECRRLQAELTRLDAELGKLRQRLANEAFVARAPQAVIDGERGKEREWGTRAEQLRVRVQAVCGS
jgi:valyl-tRNA synthetase